MSKRNDSRKEAARVVRDQLAREQRRRQQLLITVGTLVVLLIVGATGWFIYSMQQPSDYTAPQNTYKNDAGFVIGDGPNVVEIYFDFQCPACKAFELGGQNPETGETIPGALARLEPLLAQHKVKVIYYTVGILDYTSPNKYSTRAAAAAACAADDGKIAAYAKTLLQNQVEEGQPGPTNDKLIDLGAEVGLGDSFAKCVKDGKYLDWVPHVTKTFEDRGLKGTPSVFVNGKQIEQDDKETLPAYIDRVMKAAGEEPKAPASASGDTQSPSAGQSPSPSQG